MRALTTEEFIEKSRAVHGDKYDYSEVQYKNAQTPVDIICRVHGKFSQLPYNHMRGAGCAQCNKIEKRRLPIETFLSRAKQAHGDRYDYSKVEFVNTKTPVKILCGIHGVFEQTPEKHMAGQGCPKCAVNYKDNTESFIAKARAIHGDFYDYSKVEYIDEHTKVCIIDPDYGEFWQQPNAHLNGRGSWARRAEKALSTKQTLGSTVSAEDRVYDMLEKKFGTGNVCREYWSMQYPYSCDFYIKSFNLYLELNIYPSHGGHWFNLLDDSDIKKFNEYVKLAKKSAWYKTILETWVQRDPMKRLAASRNHLNYVVFWKSNLSDFMQWYNTFDFDNPVLQLF